LVQASGTLGLGRVGVDVRLDGTVVASGALYAGGPASLFVRLSKSEQEDVAVASGQALTVNAQVDQVLDAGQAIRASLTLALLQRPE